MALTGKSIGAQFSKSKRVSGIVLDQNVFVAYCHAAFILDQSGKLLLYWIFCLATRIFNFVLMNTQNINFKV